MPDGLVEHWLATAHSATGAVHEYELVWVPDSEYPDEWLDDMVLMSDVLVNDAPMEDMPIGERHTTKEQVIAHAERPRGFGREFWTLIARHRETGEPVGYTEMFLPDEDPSLGSQGATAVHEKHRGHALGRWLKAAMLDASSVSARLSPASEPSTPTRTIRCWPSISPWASSPCTPPVGGHRPRRRRDLAGEENMNVDTLGSARRVRRRTARRTTSSRWSWMPNWIRETPPQPCELWRKDVLISRRFTRASVGCLRDGDELVGTASSNSTAPTTTSTAPTST